MTLSGDSTRSVLGVKRPERGVSGRGCAEAGYSRPSSESDPCDRYDLRISTITVHFASSIFSDGLHASGSSVS